MSDQLTQKTTALLMFILLVCVFIAHAAEETIDAAMVPTQKQLNFSKAGYFPIQGSGREVMNFNVGWRFIKKNVENAHARSFNDSNWEIVSCPHGLELLESEASGSVNYQGVAWYRKHFKPGKELQGKQVSLYFEAVMGSCQVWVNGTLVTSHFGGYLPFSVDLTGKLDFGQDNIIAVKADNSNDRSYPPGKSQETLDFTYCGGIYRDVWLVTTHDIYITNPNDVDKVAGGGVFVHFEEFSKERVTLVVDTDIANQNSSDETIDLNIALIDAMGGQAGISRRSSIIQANGASVVTQKIVVDSPHLWTPDNPYLYDLVLRVEDSEGKAIDGFRQRIGIRKIEFRGQDGFYLNGEPFGEILNGVNRHQDYAYVGNAVPNSGQWRDAKKIRDAGLRIVRAAHYPMDPAFMDACDELGLFVIVATPGWQFWNKEPIFSQRVNYDIRQMIRRDRNHPCVLIWESILNETPYPESARKEAHQIVHEEYPYQGAFSASDVGGYARGYEDFDIYYYWGGQLMGEHSSFIREYGEHVDDYRAHNSDNRVSLRWGEKPQLLQALHLADVMNAHIYGQVKVLAGGTLWAGFDHQRGCHPDPFYGGLLDNFRRPKTSYYLYTSQRDAAIRLTYADSGPMVYIAHELTPFSGEDIVVFTNCDEIRLTMPGKEMYTQPVRRQGQTLPNPPVVFKNVYHFDDWVSLTRKTKDKSTLNILAEGLIDGKVAAVHKRTVARNVTNIELSVDDEGMAMVADGSDFVPVIASVTDQQGNVKRLNNLAIHFEVEGQGRIIGNHQNGANPRIVEWGTAPVLIQSSTIPGTIRIKAAPVWKGQITPIGDVIEIKSIPSPSKLIYSEQPNLTIESASPGSGDESETIQSLRRELEKVRQELNLLKLEKVSQDQENSPAAAF
jgi:beta-galactosidase